LVVIGFDPAQSGSHRLGSALAFVC